MKDIRGDIRDGVEGQKRAMQMIASGLSEVTDAVRDGLSGVADQLSTLAGIVQGGFDELNWKLQQQTQVLLSIDLTLKSPRQTKARELREMAEELRQRGELEKAEKFFLDSLDLNPLDYRTYIGLAFNYLRKSDFDKEEEVRKIDFDKAEEVLTRSFLHAPKGIPGPSRQRPVRHKRIEDMTDDESAEAAFDDLDDLETQEETEFDYKSLSHRLIGRICACRGDYGRAAAELRSAIDLSPHYPEGNYDYALYCVQSGTTSGWEEPLRRAITAQPGYLNVAWVERRFAPARQELESLLSGLLNEAYRNASQAIQDAETKFAEAQCAVADTPDTGRYKPRVNEIAALLATAKSDWDSNDYVKILTALGDATQAVALSCSLVQQRAQERAQQELAARIAKSEKARSHADTAMTLSLWGIFCCAPLAIVGLVLGINALSEFKQGQDQQGKGKAIVAVLIGSFLILILGLVFLTALIKSRP
jgi:tetratricopeptide (TPR) repeat protein